MPHPGRPADGLGGRRRADQFQRLPAGRRALSWAARARDTIYQSHARPEKAILSLHLLLLFYLDYTSCPYIQFSPNFTANSRGRKDESRAVRGSSFPRVSQAGPHSLSASSPPPTRVK